MSIKPNKFQEKKPKINKTVELEKPLPYYLLNETPIFSKKERTIEDNYFDGKTQLLADDIPKCEELLKGLITGEAEIGCKIEELKQFTFDPEVSFNSGISFYSAKNIIFNEYLICLKFYQLFRLNGADLTSGSGLRLYQRLVYLKTLILKLSPVEKKLEYQKNKLLKKGDKINVSKFRERAHSEEENHSEDDHQESEVENKEQSEQNEEEGDHDNLAYRPMVKNLVYQKAESSKGKSANKYVAPKQSSVLPAAEKALQREAEQNERKRAHLMRKIRDDIWEGDEAKEVDMLDKTNQRLKKRFEEKLQIEEENFMRIPDSKKDRQWLKSLQKNKHNSTYNDEFKEISQVREFVEEERNKTSSVRPRPLAASTNGGKATKKRKMQ